MITMKVLVVDPDEGVQVSLTEAIEQVGGSCDCESLGEDALSLLAVSDYDAVVLELKLPDVTGFEVLRRIRAAHSVPVLVLTGAPSAKPDLMLKAFELDAQDFVTKPFDSRVVLARLQVMTRRATGNIGSAIHCGNLVVDMNAREASMNGRMVPLTRNEYGIVECLARRKGVTRTKEEVLDYLYGGRDEPDYKIIDVYMCKIRRKFRALNDGETYLKTVWGRGYVMQEPEPNDQVLA